MPISTIAFAAKHQLEEPNVITRQVTWEELQLKLINGLMPASYYIFLQENGLTLEMLNSSENQDVRDLMLLQFKKDIILAETNGGGTSLG